MGRGVTEPDIKQKLGQVRGARRGRQERAILWDRALCRHQLNLPPSPSSPVLSAHPRTLLHPHSPSLLSSIFSSLYSSPSAHTVNSMLRQRIRALLVCFAKKWHARMHYSTPPYCRCFHSTLRTIWSGLYCSKQHQPKYTETAGEEGGEVISPRPVFSKCTPSVVRRGSPVKVTLNLNRRRQCSAGETRQQVIFYLSLFKN